MLGAFFSRPEEFIGMEADPDSGDEGDGRECRNRGGRRNEQQERNRRERPRETKCLRESTA